MSEEVKDSPEERSRHVPAEFLLALAAGTFVGIGLAAVWVPEKRRRRLPATVRKRYRRVRDASALALDEIRSASREIAGEFREELGANLEAAGEEFKDMARHQLEQVRSTLRRERRKVED
jgi:hypothetical protein